MNNNISKHAAPGSYNNKIQELLAVVTWLKNTHRLDKYGAKIYKGNRKDGDIIVYERENPTQFTLIECQEIGYFRMKYKSFLGIEGESNPDRNNPFPLDNMGKIDYTKSKYFLWYVVSPENEYVFLECYKINKEEWKNIIVKHGIKYINRGVNDAGIPDKWESSVYFLDPKLLEKFRIL